jgi:hypothetical protein
LAGIEGVIELQKIESHKKVPVFFYIGNMQVAKDKLKDNRERLKNFDKLEVGNRTIDIKEFLAKNLEIDFE